MVITAGRATRLRGVWTSGGGRTNMPKLTEVPAPPSSCRGGSTESIVGRARPRGLVCHLVGELIEFVERCLKAQDEYRIVSERTAEPQGERLARGRDPTGQCSARV